MTTTITLSAEDYQAMLSEQQRLASQLRLVTVERDLLKERVDAFLHRLYAAKSEARANPAQRDLFLNEAEALAPNGTPVAEESTPETVEVAGHNRKKRGRKPLDPHLPREIVRHELPEAERICGHDGTRLVEIGAEISEQLDIVPQSAGDSASPYQICLPLLRQQHSGDAGTGTHHPQRLADRNRIGLDSDCQIPGQPAAVSASRAVKPVRRRSVA